MEKSSIGVQQAMFHCRRILDPSIRKTVSKPSFALDSFFGGGAAFNTELLGGWNYMELYTWMGLHVDHASLKKSITS